MFGRVFVALIYLLPLCAPAASIVGGARHMADSGRPVAIIVGSRGNRAIVCTGTAIARDLVITAAHCVAQGTSVRVLQRLGVGTSVPIEEIARHPRFDPREYERGRVTADIGLIKLTAPLPDTISSVALAPDGERVAPGDRLLIAGFG